jgi:dipeptidase E
MRILLGSGGIWTEERVELLVAAMKDFFGSIPRLLFVPYALRDHDAYVERVVERGWHAGYDIDGIHAHRDPQTAVREASGIFIGGGNTFRLLDQLYRLDLLETIRSCVRAGLPYLGISAGTNVACPTIKTTNDMPIVQPRSLDALALVPFQINPHYFEGQVHVKRGDAYEPHFSETRDQRIAEFHEMNDTPVIGLPEGGLLRVEDHRLTLHGSNARIFRKGSLPQDVAAGASLDELLID